MSDPIIGTHLLNKTAVATRPTYNSDGQGGDTEVLMVHPDNANVKLRYFAASAREEIVGGRDDESIFFVGYVLPSVNMVRDDRLFVDDKRFDVVAALNPSLNHHIKLQLREVHGAYTVAQTKAGFDIHTKDDDGNEIKLEVKNW